MRNIAIKLEYDGTRYNGWQVQGNTERTLQGKLEELLKKLFGRYIEIHASGRTDAGVHAKGQVANFKVETGLSAEEIMDEMNKYLPSDVAVSSAWEADLKFHSRLSAKSKIYEYRILLGKPDVFKRRYSYFHPERLDIDAMKKAAEYFIGSHDFKAFCDNKRMKKSSVREIYSLEIREEGGEAVISVRGSGFLYHMVRLISGTLIEVGEGRRKPESIKAVIESMDRAEAGFLAPPEGLFLMEVFYE